MKPIAKDAPIPEFTSEELIHIRDSRAWSLLLSAANERVAFWETEWKNLESWEDTCIAQGAVNEAEFYRDLLDVKIDNAIAIEEMEKRNESAS